MINKKCYLTCDYHQNKKMFNVKIIISLIYIYMSEHKGKRILKESKHSHLSSSYIYLYTCLDN